MAELKAHLGPYKLENALATDRADEKGCFILDVGRDETGNPVSSLEHVAEIVDNYIINFHDRVAPVTKLYVTGDWKLAKQEAKSEEEKEGPVEQKRYSNEVRPHD
jgi:hypothetical protein